LLPDCSSWLCSVTVAVRSKAPLTELPVPAVSVVVVLLALVVRCRSPLSSVWMGVAVVTTSCSLSIVAPPPRGSAVSWRSSWLLTLLVEAVTLSLPRGCVVVSRRAHEESSMLSLALVPVTELLLSVEVAMPPPDSLTVTLRPWLV
jgi:hypothetical protein